MRRSLGVVTSDPLDPIHLDGEDADEASTENTERNQLR